MEVLIDTNFILSALKKKIQIFEEFDRLDFDVVIPEQVIDEIKKLLGNKEKSYADREVCSVALQLIDKKNVKIIKLNKKYVDAGIIDYCSKNSCFVATLDKELKMKLRGVRFVIIRGGGFEVV
ncbi:MAG: hypothetical protein KKF56_00940 [Nanoarchaeota archaeon]|nr:hypothetical protein [Nanoarchaeota archaeon]